MFRKEPHTALFVAPTGVGKTQLALDFLEGEYFNHFHFIIIVCPTLGHNETYKSRGWVWTDPEVIPIELGNNLHYLIEKISKLLAGSKTLFLIDDIIANEALNKHCQPLLELAISGRHRNLSLWLLTQSYTAVPNNIRRQAKMIYVWYPKNRTDLNVIHKENDVIETLEELYDEARKYFAEGKQKDNHTNEVQAQLQLHDLIVGEYLVNKYALWLDFRMTDENFLHGTGWKIKRNYIRRNYSTDREKVETAGALNAYIYLIMDAQLGRWTIVAVLELKVGTYLKK